MTVISHEHDAPAAAVQTEHPVADAAEWREAEPGFWVGNQLGNFVGTVEETGSAYIARNGVGEQVGAFTTLADARSFLTH